jgi:hypothetical protein
MAIVKVRRVRLCTRLSVPLRARLAKYCAASGLSERTIVEDALRKYLDGTGDTALLLRRFDRVDDALAREHRGLELLSEAFGRYLRLWFGAHSPSPPEGGGYAAAQVVEDRYARFARHLGEMFSEGHRFRDALPAGAFAEEEAAPNASSSNGGK